MTKVSIDNLKTKMMRGRIMVTCLLRDNETGTVLQTELPIAEIMAKSQQYEVTNYKSVVEWLVLQCGFGA
jgi:hypothetical protein